MFITQVLQDHVKSIECENSNLRLERDEQIQQKNEIKQELDSKISTITTLENKYKALSTNFTDTSCELEEETDRGDLQVSSFTAFL